jgi:Tol biopolymer transport system component
MIAIIERNARRMGKAGLEQITQDPDFDSFPMFSPDGEYIVFASNRSSSLIVSATGASGDCLSNG